VVQCGAVWCSVVQCGAVCACRGAESLVRRVVRPVVAHDT